MLDKIKIPVCQIHKQAQNQVCCSSGCITSKRIMCYQCTKQHQKQHLFSRITSQWKQLDYLRDKIKSQEIDKTKIKDKQIKGFIQRQTLKNKNIIQTKLENCFKQLKQVQKNITHALQIIRQEIPIFLQKQKSELARLPESFIQKLEKSLQRQEPQVTYQLLEIYLQQYLNKVPCNYGLHQMHLQQSKSQKRITKQRQKLIKSIKQIMSTVQFQGDKWQKWGKQQVTVQKSSIKKVQKVKFTLCSNHETQPMYSLISDYPYFYSLSQSYLHLFHKYKISDPQKLKISNGHAMTFIKRYQPSKKPTNQYTSNNNYIAIASEQKIQIVDLCNKQIVNSFNVGQKNYAIAQYADLLAVSSNNNLAIYNYNNSSKVDQMKPLHNAQITSIVTIQPYIITGSYDKTIKILTVQKNKIQWIRNQKIGYSIQKLLAIDQNCVLITGQSFDVSIIDVRLKDDISVGFKVQPRKIQNLCFGKSIQLDSKGKINKTQQFNFYPYSITSFQNGYVYCCRDGTIGYGDLRNGLGFGIQGHDKDICIARFAKNELVSIGLREQKGFFGDKYFGQVKLWTIH